MACDLEGVYGSLAAQLPESPDSEPFALDESVLPAPPAEFSTNRLRGKRSYLQRLPGCRGDNVDIIAPRSAFRHLGLLALAVLFHQKCNTSTIHLTDPESQLKHIVITCGHPSGPTITGLCARPHVLGYVPEESSHTFSTEEVGYSAPVLRLTNLVDSQRNESDWQNRDTLTGIGGMYATAEVAEFLLNAGRSDATGNSFTIPANGAFFTAEVRFWVPKESERMQRGLVEFVSRQRHC